MIRIQVEPFDESEAFTLRRGRADVGGLVSFTGYVRDFTQSADVTSLELQHYPGFTETEISKIVEGVQTQTKALDAYVRVNEQQTAKAITDAQAQIAKLEDQVITLRADIDKRTNALAGLAAAADVRKRQVSKVLDFFHTPSPAAPAGAPAASKADE